MFSREFPQSVSDCFLVFFERTLVYNARMLSKTVTQLGSFKETHRGSLIKTMKQRYESCTQRVLFVTNALTLLSTASLSPLQALN